MEATAGGLYVLRRPRGLAPRVQILSIEGAWTVTFRIVYPPTSPAVRCWVTTWGKFVRRFSEDPGTGFPDVLARKLSTADLRSFVGDLQLDHACDGGCKSCRPFRRR